MPPRTDASAHSAASECAGRSLSTRLYEVHPVAVENGTELEIEIRILRDGSELYVGGMAPGAIKKFSVEVVEESLITVNALVNGKQLSLTDCYMTKLGGSCRFIIEPRQIRFEFSE